jgi:hypothetical protein
MDIFWLFIERLKIRISTQKEVQESRKQMRK